MNQCFYGIYSLVVPCILSGPESCRAVFIVLLTDCHTTAFPGTSMPSFPLQPLTLKAAGTALAERRPETGGLGACERPRNTTNCNRLEPHATVRTSLPVLDNFTQSTHRDVHTTTN